VWRRTKARASAAIARSYGVRRSDGVGSCDGNARSVVGRCDGNARSGVGRCDGNARSGVGRCNGNARSGVGRCHDLGTAAYTRPMDLPSADRHARIDVPPDPRDFAGTFPKRLVVEVRFGDTDAMGHANNSRFLTYCESARIDYWQAATGEPFAMATHGAEESLILAEARVSFRSPAIFGEVLTVETRAARIGRTSFGLQHRLTASASDRGPARLVATAEDVLVFYDYANARPRVIPDDLVARLEAYEGRRLRD
jgi:acyl-CoA thioester hydrolase